MSETKGLNSGLTRRSFLKTTGVVAGAAAAVGSTTTLTALAKDGESKDINQSDEVYTSFCRGNCGSYGCNLGVHVRDGKVVRVAPQPYPDADPETQGRGRACLRGLSNIRRLYASDRINYPMRRVGSRGAGEWERISWDEAISEIAQKWKSYLNEYGAGSVARWTIYGNTGTVQTGASWTRLVNTTGMSTIETGADWALIYTLPTFIMSLGLGSDGPGLAQHARNVIVWGANPAETWPHEWRYILDAQENGAKVIVIDPRHSVTVDKADVHVPLRLATDAAFAMGVCNYLIENNMIDKAFLKKSSTAPCLVRKKDGHILRKSDYGYKPLPGSTTSIMSDDFAYVWDGAQGKAVPTVESVDPVLTGSFLIDNVEYTTTLELLIERVSEWTLEHTAEVCDTDQSNIILVAEALANGPTSVMMGNGAGHYTNSHTYFTASLAAAILTGNFYKPGAGWANAGVSSDILYYADASWGEPPNSVAGPSYSSLDFADIMKSGEYMGKPAVIKGLITYAGNPVGNVPDRKAFLEALEKIELFVSVEMSMTDTAEYADIILPCCHWFEMEDVGGMQYVPYANLGEKAIEPTFEHKSDFDIVKLLAHALGYGDAFKETAEEVVKICVDKGMMPDIKGGAITYERLKQEKNIRTFPDGYYNKTSYLQDARLFFYLENPVPRFAGKKIDVELERLPYFEPPAEAWPHDVGKYKKNVLADKYPLVFQSLHTRFTTHTTYNHVEWLVELRGGEPSIYLNANDAKVRDIHEGDIVKVFNDRGYVVVKALYDAGLKPGIVNLPHGWGYDQFREGHYQDLTNRATHAFDGNECYFDCLCEVEKYKGGGVK